jgi:hypothetical protein
MFTVICFILQLCVFCAHYNACVSCNVLHYYCIQVVVVQFGNFVYLLCIVQPLSFKILDLVFKFCEDVCYRL